MKTCNRCKADCQNYEMSEIYENGKLVETICKACSDTEDNDLRDAAPELYRMLRQIKEEFFDSGLIGLEEYTKDIEAVLNKASRK